jgi:hypothetical protein
MVVFKSIAECPIARETLQMNFCQDGLYVEIQSASSSQMTNFIIPNEQLDEFKLFIMKGE